MSNITDALPISKKDLIGLMNDFKTWVQTQLDLKADKTWVQTQINTAISNMSKGMTPPNWSQITTITTTVNTAPGYTTPKDGWIVCYKTSTEFATVTVNDHAVWQSRNHSGGGDDNGVDGGMIPVGSGDIVYSTTNNITSCWFVPCKD